MPITPQACCIADLPLHLAIHGHVDKTLTGKWPVLVSIEDIQNDTNDTHHEVESH